MPIYHLKDVKKNFHKQTTNLTFHFPSHSLWKSVFNTSCSSTIYGWRWPPTASRDVSLNFKCLYSSFFHFYLKYFIPFWNYFILLWHKYFKPFTRQLWYFSIWWASNTFHVGRLENSITLIGGRTLRWINCISLVNVMKLFTHNTKRTFFSP